ncbi:MAG: sensor histidine kinase [Agathobacter sp.]|nr:sensor histidine kinase [Agathobacter sp.]
MLKNQDYERLLHEIKNAVCVISCSLQLIERSHPEVSDYAFWQDTTSDLTSLRTLLVDVSNTQLSSHPKKESVNLEAFLNEVKSACPAAGTSGHPLVIDIEKGLTEGYFDPARIQHALLKILDNAFDALYEDGVVLLRVYSRENGIVFQIRDNGRGIAKDALPQIFQPFFGSKSGKSGLGLPISKGIVESHGGTLTIESELAKGTTITIFLPVD